MTCYLKSTQWIPEAGQAQSNYTPGRHGAFAQTAAEWDSVSLQSLVKIHLGVYEQMSTKGQTSSAGLHPGGTDLQLELNGENAAFPELNHRQITLNSLTVDLQGTRGWAGLWNVNTS